MAWCNETNISKMSFVILDKDAGRLRKTLAIIAFFLNYEWSQSPSCNFNPALHCLKDKLRNKEHFKMEFKNYRNKSPFLSWFNFSQVKDMNGNSGENHNKTPISGQSDAQQETEIGLRSFCELPFMGDLENKGKNLWYLAQVKSLKKHFPIKTKLQEMFPSFETKVLANSYCLSDLFEGVPVKEQALDHIKQWIFNV